MQPGRNQPLKKIVAEALHEWLEAQEDAELLPEIEAARAEWQRSFSAADFALAASTFMAV